MRKLLRELFFLKKGEQRALFVVGFILLTSLAIRIYIPRHQDKASIADTEFMVQMDLLKGKIDSMNRDRKNVSRSVVSTVKKLTPFPFDPNNVSREELEEMNFPYRVRSNLLSYRRAGGEFYSSEDLRKIYGMDSLTFNSIENYIYIEHKIQKPVVDLVKIERRDNSIRQRIEVNHADSTDLIMINGIGAVYSGRIIKYKNLLGGYSHIEQLWEVYGMDTLKYTALRDILYVDTANIQKIDINTASFSKMISHPYLNRKEVTSLLHYREFAKEINNLTELKSAHVLDSIRYQKIRPYLRCGINED